ncbi:hypothetical protein AVEN_240097-1 [Araneus ventricosus]|uniref:Uncharacterized protein n=1 Tax=Araneus ventricosus TaxID=182803 RepID=A0A4Y2NI20_ARAVE|nr:hypothetical protein AVEN_240097-1 [Araneus ventricosus]
MLASRKWLGMMEIWEAHSQHNSQGACIQSLDTQRVLFFHRTWPFPSFLHDSLPETSSVLVAKSAQSIMLRLTPHTPTIPPTANNINGYVSESRDCLCVAQYSKTMDERACALFLKIREGYSFSDELVRIEKPYSRSGCPCLM